MLLIYFSTFILWITLSSIAIQCSAVLWCIVFVISVVITKLFNYYLLLKQNRILFDLNNRINVKHFNKRLSATNNQHLFSFISFHFIPFHCIDLHFYSQSYNVALFAHSLWVFFIRYFKKRLHWKKLLNIKELRILLPKISNSKQQHKKMVNK